MAIIWWPVAFILAAVYFVYLMRHYSGKVRLAEDTQSYIKEQGTESGG
jgi:hypothetical protein